MNTRANRLANFLSYVITAILVLLPFHAWFTTWLGNNFGHLNTFKLWKEILIVLMVPPAVWLVARDKKMGKQLIKSWLFRLFVVYIFIHLALGGWAYAHHQVNRTALADGLITNLRFTGFFFICLTTASGSNWLARHWLKIVLWPAAAVVLFGLFQRFLLPSDFLRHFGYDRDTIKPYQMVDNNPLFPRLQSTLRGPNPLGAYLIMPITALSVVWRRYRYWTIAAGLAAIVVLFYSYSRSALLGLALALVILGWLKLDGVWKKRLLLAAVPIIMAAAAGLYAARSTQMVQDTLLHTSSNSASSVSSNDARGMALRDAIRDIAHHPLGSGPGTAGPASLHNLLPAHVPENYYLQLGEEVGIFGLLVFVAINGLVAYELWKRRSENLPAILLATFAGIAFINLVLPAWTDDTLSLIWWGLAGVALAPVILRNKNNPNEKKPA